MQSIRCHKGHSWLNICCCKVFTEKRKFIGINFEASRCRTPHKKMQFSIKDFFSKCNQIRGKLRIWSDLLKKSFTLFRMGILEAAQGWGEAKRPSLQKICYTHPTMMKLGTVIPYLKKVQKIYESPDTPLDFCWHQHVFTRNH